MTEHPFIRLDRHLISTKQLTGIQLVPSIVGNELSEHNPCPSSQGSCNAPFHYNIESAMQDSSYSMLLVESVLLSGLANSTVGWARRKLAKLLSQLNECLSQLTA
jgi:hypothetical protein